MSTKCLRIRTEYVYAGYEQSSLFMALMRRVSPVPIDVNGKGEPHAVITGPYKNLLARTRERFIKRKRKGPIAIYHTGENTRFDPERYDYAITADFGIGSDRHFRAPNWWGSIDWRHCGIERPVSKRIRRLIDLKTLLTPLGEETLQRERKAALFTSHLNEPRGTLLREVKASMPVDCYGPYFDKSVTDHNASGVFKDDVLAKYMFSLCPENSMYPGYYTEKVPESFAAGCIPLTWADQNMTADFNPGSFVNLADYASLGYGHGLRSELTPERLETLTQTPLLKQEPDFRGYVRFAEMVVSRALSRA